MRVLILLLVLAGACTRSETTEPVEVAVEPAPEEATKSNEEAPAEPPIESPPGIEAPVDVESPPTVELVDAGAEPRQAMRFGFEAGAKQSVTVKSAWKVSTVYGPMLSVELTMPSITYELDVEVEESSSERARFALRVKSIGVEGGDDVKPEQVKAVTKSANSLEGAKGTFVINSRGMVEELTLDVSADQSLILHDMVDQLEQAVRSFSVPLPEEPVGKGATWTASQTVEQRTAKIRQTTTFTLADAKGNTVQTTSKHEAAAPNQNLKMPGGRSDKSFRLDGIEYSGGGKGTWRLDRLGPSSAADETLTVFGMTAREPRREAVLMAVGTAVDLKAKH